MTGAAFFVSAFAFYRLGAGRSPAQCGRSPQQSFPRPRLRGRGLRGKGAHCLASLTHVFKLMPLPSGEGKGPPFYAMPQFFVKSPKKARCRAASEPTIT